MRKSRTYGSVRGARDETRVPTVTVAVLLRCVSPLSGVKRTLEMSGVRYVLEGSVRKAGNRVRISTQLVDASDGHHVWADRYDRALEDIFSVQDEMTNQITSAIAPGIVAAEVQRAQAKDAKELSTWERLMHAHWHIQRFTGEDFTGSYPPARRAPAPRS
jgi:hypothetical protein